jgi:SPP1 family predicted phage head-tail adaptor
MPATNRRRGALRERLHFQSRATADDGFGNQIPAGDFETRFTIFGHLHPLRGSETVIASRLEGRQPYILTVRMTGATKQVNEAWQIVDAHDANRIFSITAPPTDPDGKNQWLEMLVVQNGRS